MTDHDRTRVGAYAICLDDDGRILLCHLSPSVLPGEVWTLPGGGLEFGEAPSAAVVRELSEESRYDGEVTALADVSDRLFTDPDDGARMHAIRIVYRVRITGGELQDEVDGSTDACAWFGPDDLDGIRLVELAEYAVGLTYPVRA